MKSRRPAPAKTHAFGSPFARDLFALGVELSQSIAVPLEVLDPAEAARRRASAEIDEIRSEGRQHFNIRPQRNGP